MAEALWPEGDSNDKQGRAKDGHLTILHQHDVKFGWR